MRDPTNEPEVWFCVTDIFAHILCSRKQKYLQPKHISKICPALSAVRFQTSKGEHLVLNLLGNIASDHIRFAIWSRNLQCLFVDFNRTWNESSSSINSYRAYHC